MKRILVNSYRINYSPGIIYIYLILTIPNEVTETEVKKFAQGPRILKQGR